MMKRLTISVCAGMLISAALFFSPAVFRHAAAAEGEAGSGQPADSLAPGPGGEKKGPEDLIFENGDVVFSTNIHYTGKYCNECHEKDPVEGGDTYLKFGGDYGELCRCHNFPPDNCPHPVNVIPSAGIKARMPSDLPLENEKVTCLTCHDIYLQCREQLFRKNSTRGEPYPNRTDFCYRCHDVEKYKEVDPHVELSEKGEILKDTCLICHKEVPDEKKDTYETVTFEGDIEEMCRRCHQVSGNHSGDHDHIGVKPSEKALRRIEAMEKKYNVRLPLDQEGEMTCITCHNPHAKGVIPEENPGARGADSKYRLRLSENMCMNCHQM